MKKNIDFEKLGEIMDLERFDGETWEDVFMREVGDTTAVPDKPDIVTGKQIGRAHV